MDMVTISNLVLSVIILIMGVWEYTRSQSRTILYIGIAFGLFAITHLLNLLGLGATLSGLILVIRVLGYLTVIYAIYIVMAKKKKAF
ncbi:MAG: hypothetical protein ACYDHZ_04080 [Dehalococcoidia bacterium]|jgi:hypothetical protein